MSTTACDDQFALDPTSAVSADIAAAAEPMYYLQDSRSYVGNCPLWWAMGGSGYTTSLDRAHRYTLGEALRQHEVRDTDVPWLCEKIDAIARPTADIQDMGSVKKHAANLRRFAKRSQEIKP